MSTPINEEAVSKEQTPAPEVSENTPAEDVEMNDAETTQNDGTSDKTSAGTPALDTPQETPAPAAEASPVIDYSEESKKIEEKAKIYLARQTKTVIVPAFSAWFDMEKIHEIEKKSLPEFFNNNSRFKTDKIYQDIRNFMINAYRLNPTEYLTVTAARRNIAADVASIIRIHAFLEQWGLINYQIDPKTRPSLVGPQYTGHFQIILDTPDGLKPYIPENAKVINIKDAKSEGNGVTEGKKENDKPAPTDFVLNMELRKNVYDSTHDAVALNESDRVTSGINTKTFTCTVTGNDTTEVRYHNLKTKGSISAKAFKEGQFGANFTSADFVRLDGLQKSNDFAPWSNQETLLLLEGIEMFEDDWEKISQHVATKSKEQCITKFIQLPIEDNYLTKTITDAKKTNKETTTTTESATTSSESHTNEAVRQTIKFLIKNIDPELASRDFLNNDADVQKAIKYTVGSIVGGAKAQQETIKTESSQLMNDLVMLEIQKVEQKLSKLALLEKQMEQEKAELAQQRKELILDRLSLKKQAVTVRGKLIEATRATDPQAAVQIAQSALDIAVKAPRVAIATTSAAAVAPVDTDQEAKDKEAAETEDVLPVSMEAPEVYQIWKS